MEQKKIIILEGPSCCGKTTIIDKLVKELPQKYEKIVGYTSRPMRVGEIDGYNYIFISEPDFKDKIKTGEIFEFTVRHGSFRGMGKSLIDKILNKNKIAIKDADILGVRALRKTYPNLVTTIFITAKKKTIKRRLINRGDLDIDTRMCDYDDIHKYIKEYDYIITNNGKIDKTIKRIREILGD
jgi:guanylate kinase